jgi:hypothetical protein
MELPAMSQYTRQGESNVSSAQQTYSNAPLEVEEQSEISLEESTNVSYKAPVTPVILHKRLIATVSGLYLLGVELILRRQLRMH